MNMPEICTIGYEACDLDDFVEVLLDAGIETLLDVRELPASRRKGFSKNKLREALEERGIAYVHLRGLGDPKPGRDAAKSGRFAQFVAIFKAHMKTELFKTDLEKAVKIASDTSVCLMCYERDYKTCHRKFVADALYNILGVKPRHLGVPKGIAKDGRKIRKRAGADISQSSAEYYA
jgi:uncharacterized protein (DUF488 family)